MPTKRELYEENEALRDILEDVKTRLNDIDSDEDDSEDEDEEESEESEDED